MRTTLMIPDTIFKRLKSYAKKENESISHMVSEALELYIINKNKRNKNKMKKRKIKTYSMGKASVDISNRDELYRKMES